VAFDKKNCFSWKLLAGVPALFGISGKLESLVLLE
jgi:hypothetical protein